MPMFRTFLGDSEQVLKGFPSNSLFSCVTDPPYGLGAEPDVVELIKAWLDNRKLKAKKGFMNEDWDGYVPHLSLWKEVFRVLREGAYLFTFASTRTSDLIGISLRLAGFEVRDQIAWIYGEGMPSGNLNVAEDLRKRGYDASPFEGMGTRLLPSFEPIIIARKPFKGPLYKNLLENQTGALNIKATRIPREDADKLFIPAVEKDYDFSRAQFQKSKKVGSVNTDCLDGGWPRNVIFEDGSILHVPESAQRYFYCVKAKRSERELGTEGLPSKTSEEITQRKEGSVGKDYGGAGAGRTSKDGVKNFHPTVKPVELMRYLCRMACPPNREILDPFMGSGTTGVASILEGFDFVGIEREEKFKKIAEARIDFQWRKEFGL